MSDQKQEGAGCASMSRMISSGRILAVAHGDEAVAPLNQPISEFLDRGEPGLQKLATGIRAKTKHFRAFVRAWPVHCVQETRVTQNFTRIFS